MAEEKQFKRLPRIRPNDIPMEGVDELSAGMVFSPVVTPETPSFTLHDKLKISVPLPQSGIYDKDAVRFRLAGNACIRIVRGTVYERMFDPKTAPNGIFEERRDVYDLYLRGTGFFREI